MVLLGFVSRFKTKFGDHLGSFKSEKPVETDNPLFLGSNIARELVQLS